LKQALASKVHLTWLFSSAILAAALVIVWKVAILDAPPSGGVVITRAERTPIALTSQNGEATREPTQPASDGVWQVKVNGDAQVTSTPVDVVSTATPVRIVVYVSGAVSTPGVYTLREGARVAEALDAAGGPAEQADLDRVNLAARLSDEEHIAVPRRGETVLPDVAPEVRPAQPRSTPTRPAAISTQASPASTVKIDINRATVAELQTLPGIGPVLAGRIVEYREANGPFRTIEQLMQVPGIKDALLERVRPFILAAP
jgi:competence protein ComEA